MNEIQNAHIKFFNTVDAINTIEIAKIPYTAEIIDSTITELEELGRIICKSLCKKIIIRGKRDRIDFIVRRSGR